MIIFEALGIVWVLGWVHAAALVIAFHVLAPERALVSGDLVDMIAKLTYTWPNFLERFYRDIVIAGLRRK